MKTVFIAWAPTSRRSESIAEALRAKIFLLHYKFRKKIYAPLKYPYLSFKTLLILLKEKPDLIFVQNPPPLLPLTCLVFTKSFGKRLIIDAHTGPWKTFWERLWFWNKFIFKSSDVVIVTNRYITDALKYHNVNFFILPDRTPKLPKKKKIKLKKGVNIAVINTFSEDEPLNEILMTAENFKNVNFYITGNLAYARPNFVKNKPDNVIYTGFLPEDEYIGLLRSVDGIMVLTTRNHTMLSGAYEAVAVEKPMIISNWPALTKYFDKGAVYTDNSSRSIIKAIKKLIENKMQLNREIKILKKEHEETWSKKFKNLSNLLKTYEF